MTERLEQSTAVSSRPKKAGTKKKSNDRKKSVSSDDGASKGSNGSVGTPATPITPLTPPCKPQSCRKKSESTPVQGTGKHESVAKSFIEKIDFEKAKSDYYTIQSLPVNIEIDCKKWAANKKSNRSDEFPTLDSNLVKLDEYVNMAQVDGVLPRPVLIGQFPVADQEAQFWQAVFDKRTMRTFICGDDDITFFPRQSDEYKTFGLMWVNNRFAEDAGEITFAKIEVLPPECSNSVISETKIIKYWPSRQVPLKNAAVIKEAITLLDYLKIAQPDDNVLILSLNGGSRSTFFLALAVAIHKLEEEGVEPSIADIVKTICMQRPKTEGSFVQYMGIYTYMFYFIKRKYGNLTAKCEELTNLFATKVMAEENLAGPSQMGTVTNSTTTTTTTTTSTTGA